MEAVYLILMEVTNETDSMYLSMTNKAMRNIVYLQLQYDGLFYQCH